MRKIRYLILIIPVLVVMLFSRINVNAVELGVSVNDVYDTINGEPNWQEIYVPDKNELMIDIIKDMVLEKQLFILNNTIAIIDDNNYVLMEQYVFSLYYDIGAGDGIIVLDGQLFPFTVEELDLLYNYNWSIIFTQRKEESYNEGYQKGLNEMQAYYESILPGLLQDEYNLGYDNGWLDFYESTIGDVPSWLINSNLKLNEELYNYIDYDNLIYYENVGRLEVENITSSSGEPEIITKRYYIIVNDLNFADYDSYSTFSNSWGFENRNILNRDREGFQFRVGSDGTKYIYFRVNQDKLIYLGDTWTERITNYLQINPLTITYELKEKQQTQITELDLKQLPFYNIGYSKGDRKS